MRTVTITEGFPQWRDKARDLLLAKVSPGEVLWTNQVGDSLFGDEPLVLPKEATLPRVPKEFLSLAQMVSHHSAEDRWGLLYKVLWRLTRGGEKDLLKIGTDPDTLRLNRMRKELGRDIHKMHAFVRFKKVGEEGGREQFVSWFEPEHQIMPLTANFFRKRFTGMDWTIFTPTGSATWDGKSLELGPGVEKIDVPDEELEDLWRGYYKSIFNPARLKKKAMMAEMPKKYWKNLPEAELIDELISESKPRVGDMMEEEGRPLREVKNNAYLGKLRELSDMQSEVVTDPDSYVGSPLDELEVAAKNCQACPLYEGTTGTVFGKGPSDARIMFVGEQPGDKEDLAQEPFIGPAGKLLDECMQAAGIDRTQAYVTNAVKHFKFEMRGKFRLHKSPGVREVQACKPWVISEILQVKPKVIVCLGATAAKSLVDKNFKITQQRGLVEGSDLAEVVIATVHPSYLLRLPDKVKAEEERAKFVKDLEMASRALAE